MNKNQATPDDVLQWVCNELDPERRTEIEERIKADAVLAHDAEELAAALNAVTPEQPYPLSDRFNETLRQKVRATQARPSRILKFFTAAAAVILLALIVYHGLPGLGPVAYGMTDVPRMLGTVNILHLKSVMRMPPMNIYPPLKGLTEPLDSPSECWIDQANSRLRWIGYQYLDAGKNFIATREEQILDGTFILDLDHTKKTARYSRANSFDRRLLIRQVRDSLLTNIMGDPNDLTAYAKTGQETLAGTRLDIWERTITLLTRNLRIRSWLNPATGHLAKITVGIDSHYISGSWDPLLRIDPIEYNPDLAVGTFSTEPPAGYSMVNDKTTALAYEPAIGRFSFDDLQLDIHACFILPDHSVILGWSGRDRRNRKSQDRLFEGLTKGGPLPKLPVEINFVTPVGEGKGMIYKGRHLAFTRKGGTFYEWALYTPLVASPPRGIIGYKGFCRSNLAVEDLKYYFLQVKPYVFIRTTLSIASKADFDTFVSGVMTQLSNGTSPSQSVTYEDTLKISQNIRDEYLKTHPKQNRR